MKIELDTDELTVDQLYALSWMVLENREVYKAVVKEHNRRDQVERHSKVEG